jgi:hypothetical protein
VRDGITRHGGNFPVMTRLVLRVSVLAACMLPSWQTAASSPDQGSQAATNMASIYQHICLDAFPDPKPTGAALADAHAIRMPPNETATLLRGGPGSGWRLSTATADYTVTIEAPPYSTCSVRRMTRTGLPTALPYISALQAYARRHAMVLGAVATLEQKTVDGADETILATPLTPKSAKAGSETSMYATADYHGHYAGWAQDDAAGGPGVEVRMEHYVPVGR